MKVAFYGGSFDPPHVAHVLLVTYALTVEAFERVLVMPVFSHAFDKQLAPFEHRLRMCELAMGWLPEVEVSPLEASLGAPSLTLRTLECLRRTHPDYELRLVVGADVLGEEHQWHAFDRIVEVAPPWVVGRVGVTHPAAPPPILPDVSSSRVRALLRRRAEKEVSAELRALVPREVLAYIDREGLYR
jgi:nicotinate-nucleotide adenylyltransferase